MSVDRQPDLRPSYLEHRAMRIDAERLQTIVSSARPADAERLTDLASWYARLLAAQPLLLRVLYRLVLARATTAWPARCATPARPRRLPERRLQHRER